MIGALGPFDSGREFIKAVDSALESSLHSKGFLRLGKLNFVFPLNDDFDGWFGLGRNNKYASLGEIRLVVNWGIHCRPIEKLKSEWHGEPYKRGYLCTAPTGYGTQCFEFRASNRLNVTANAVADFYMNEIVPDLEEYSSYETIIPCLRSRADRLGGWDQSLLLAYQLAGLDAKASAYEEELANKCNTDTAFSDYFGPFLARYRQEFGRQSTS